MAIIETYDFSKDKKSTKIPSVKGTQHNVTFKENVSIDNPIFILSLNTTPVFNYVKYIFNYYFVDDIIMISKELYEVRCSLDVLATYRDDIIGSTQFVTRSASNYNINMVDNEVTNTLLQNKDVLNTNISKLSGSSYLVRVLGKEADSSPYGITTYVMTAEQISEVVYNIFNNQAFQQTGFSLDAMFLLLRSLFFDPYKYLISINWIPVEVSARPKSQVSIGWLEITPSSGYLGILNHEDDVSFMVINTPQRYFNDFRDFDDRFTQFRLSIPSVGVIPVNPADVYAGLSVSITVEYLTGMVSYYIYNTQTSGVVGKYKTNISTEIQIGGLTNSARGGLSIGSVLNAPKDLLLAPNVDVIGNIGSKAEIKYDHEFRLTRRIFGTGGIPVLNKGRPLNEYRVLNTLQGYCECKDAILETTAYGEIKDRIISYMNTGFIIQ